MLPVPSTSAATLLATTLIVAEFDIDTGACLRAWYPRVASAASPSPSTADSVEAAVPPGIAGHAEYFANVMLPDGAEKVSVTRTVFVVNRPQPPVFLRFPVYRFFREDANAATSRFPHGSPPPSSGADAGTHWGRAPSEEAALYVPEMLLINTSSRAISLKYKDIEVKAPMVVPIENLSSLPSLPPDVVRFTKQLEAMLMNEATLSSCHSSSFAAGGGESSTGDGGGAASPAAAPSSVPYGGGGNGGNNSRPHDYAFVVIAYADDRQEGYLMRLAHFERFLKEMTVLESAERSAASKTTAAAAASGTIMSTATAPSVSSSQLGVRAANAPYSGESGPLGALGSIRQGEVGGSVTMPDSLHHPHCKCAGDSIPAPAAPTIHFGSSGGLCDRYGGKLCPDSAEPSATEARSYADSSISSSAPNTTADVTSTLHNSLEGTGQLRLPRDNSVRSSSSDTSDAGVADATTFTGGLLQGKQVFADPAAPPLDQAMMTPGKSSVKQPGAEGADGPVLYGLCAVVSKRDSTARRGGITKSVAVLGPSLVWLEPFFPVLVTAAQYCCNVRGTDEEALKELQRILKRCYDSINNAASIVAAGRAKVDELTAEIGKYCTLGSGQRAYVYYNDTTFETTIKAKIPLSSESNDIAFTKYNIETLIMALGPSSMQLIIGVLTEKKILILSRKGEASDVCEVALSLGIIGNLLDRSFMAKKVFPYVSVSSMDYFLQVPGYIVGTLNPIFENVSPWGWDLLCDLDNRIVMTAAERMLRKPTGLSASAAGNWVTATAGLANAVGVGSGGAEAEALRNLPAPLQQLYKKLVNNIFHLRALRVGTVERNRRLRLILEDFLYTTVMVGYVTGSNISVPSALYPVFAHSSLGVLRLEMMLTSMLDNVSTQVLYPKESPVLLLNCAALRLCASGETPVQRTLMALLELLESPYDVKLFLRRMALAVGGLNAVGMQLTHPSLDAREAAAALLARVESVPEGKAAVASMNNFFLVIYENGVKGAKR
ncbi:hypothetical protein ABL78_4961 [Leptomonas seymouri]|uniref:Arf3-interacting protein 1 N-terminal domain-containing protein n=1 Tax=Leptomonas seymouri TaxID=5684 RepID=A0A0N0P522_LEPSE|nr:hypothetical protein ABL78_4961 [Leptomonas seymouri]|eukprot:KPI85959.1 hypothetical protein ABL78_4961 [Leptomonas seymouri]